MKTKFKLNTDVRGTGRIKGWSSQCDLDDTIKNTPAEQRAELVAAIESATSEAWIKLQRCQEEIRSPRAVRGTRTGRAIGSRYDRAYNKFHSLAGAIEKLQSLAA
jgi:hypothetical protein